MGDSYTIPYIHQSDWRPPMPYWTLHSIFHLDSQYVIDLLSGISLPSTNLELTLLLLDYFHYLQSNSYVELRKVKSHTGITGNDRADSNAAKGVTSRSPIGRFSSFPPSPLPSLPLSTPPSLPPDATTFNLIQTISTHADNCFPSKPPGARKPYISTDTITLIAQLTASPPDLQKNLPKQD